MIKEDLLKDLKCCASDKGLKACKKCSRVGEMNCARSLKSDILNYLKQFEEPIITGSPIDNLKPGLIVKTKNGDMFLTLPFRKRLMLINQGRRITMSSYYNDLKNKYDHDYDIIEIYKPLEAFISLKQLFNDRYLKSIWKRKEEE